jgi:rhomboid family GlyGly-CTERM serine protease
MPLATIVVAVGLWLAEPYSSEVFAYDRNLISDGEWWRYVTGHFLHTNSYHLLLNVAGLGLLWALHGFYYQYKSIIWVILLCIGTSSGIYFFSKNLVWYVGLSGMLHGLFIIGAYFDVTKKMKTGWLLLIAVWVKVIYEQYVGPSQEIAELIGANVAIDAHLYGTITGSLMILYLYFNKGGQPKNHE